MKNKNISETDIKKMLSKYQEEGLLKIIEPQMFSFGDYNQCKLLFTTAMLATDKTIKKLVWIPEYDEIVNWMVNNRGKGLALVGSNGRGKSIFLCRVLPFLFRIKDKVLKPKLAITLKSEDVEILETKWAIVLDDIGQEQIINDFGTKIDAVEKLISICEAEMRPLFISTNLTYSQLQKRYGSRITDRINRLCKIVEFSGKSFRK